jgi:hypothetical protein
MELEKQVCSVSLARKLNELCPDSQVSQFVYIHEDSGTDTLTTWADRAARSYYVAAAWCCAFTVAELGEMLPWGDVVYIKVGPAIWLAKMSTLRMNPDAKPHEAIADTEADARAKMLIYLIENGLIQPEAAGAAEPQFHN